MSGSATKKESRGRNRSVRGSAPVVVWQSVAFFVTAYSRWWRPAKDETIEWKEKMHDQHEKWIFESFLVRGRQGRYMALLAVPHERQKLLDRLADGLELDPRYARLVGPTDQNPERLERILVEPGGRNPVPHHLGKPVAGWALAGVAPRAPTGCGVWVRHDPVVCTRPAGILRRGAERRPVYPSAYGPTRVRLTLPRHLR